MWFPGNNKRAISRVRIRGFTLIELLVVIGIMGLLLVLSLPAFQGLGRGANTRAAVQQLRATIGLARQWAIVNRENAYVVFVHEDAAKAAGKDHLDKALRCYGVYTKSGGYVQNWTYLPPGVIFVRSESDLNSAPGLNDNKSLFSAAPNPTGKTWSLPFPLASSGNQSVRGIEFRPDGSSSLGSEAEIYIAEGTINVNTNGAGTLDSPFYRPRPNTTLVSVEVYKLTGRTAINEYSDQL